LFGLDFKNSFEHLLVATGFIALNKVLAKAVQYFQKRNKKSDEATIQTEFEKAMLKKQSIDRIITSPEALSLQRSRNQNLKIIRALIVKDLDQASVQADTPPPKDYIDLTPTFNLYVQESRLFLLENKSSLIGYLEPPVDKSRYVITVFYTSASKPNSIERRTYKLNDSIRIP